MPGLRAGQIYLRGHRTDPLAALELKPSAELSAAQSIEEGLGEEPVDTTPDGRKVEMFEDRRHENDDWTHDDMFSPSEEDNFKFDDDHGDPLCDDDLI